MKSIFKLLSLAFLFTFAYSIEHGEVVSKNGVSLAWDKNENKFVSLEQFFRNYAQSKGGITWGESENYPPYHKVKELDLFMVKIDNKICLMEFFHERWRRANDVRRWDEKFNEFSACPIVFD